MSETAEAADDRRCALIMDIDTNPVIGLLGRRLRLAVIGGGPGSFIGAMHRTAARLDDRYDLVAGALSSDPIRSREAGLALGLAEDRAYPTAAFRDVTAPNADTLYCTAWVDLGAEPWVVSWPAMPDRYYLMPMLDGWTNVIAVAGARTTGDQAQTYVLAGPRFRASPRTIFGVGSPRGCARRACRRT